MKSTEINEKDARLYWQCRRGMLELDLMLQGFFNMGYNMLSAREQNVFEQLLNHSDEMLLEYFMGRTIPMDPELASVVDKIRSQTLY